MNEIDDFASPLGGDDGSIWLNDLFERTRRPGTTEELSSEADVVGAMVRTFAHPPLVSDIDSRRQRRMSKTATRTAIVAAVLFVGTSTAAATGNLPDAAQSAVSRASSHLGVHLPDPREDRHEPLHATAPQTDASSTTQPPNTSTSSTVPDDRFVVTVPPISIRPTVDTTSSTSPSTASTASPQAPADTQVVPSGTDAPGPDANGPAKQGLCRAWAAHGSDSPANQHSKAMKNLEVAAAAAGQTVAQFCAEFLGPDATEVATTTTTETSTSSPGDDQGSKEKNQKKDKPGVGPGGKKPKNAD